MIEVLASFIVFIFTLLLIVNWQKHNFWKSKGISTPPCRPVLGHLLQFHIGKRWDNVDKLYYEYKDKGYYGVYELFKPVLHVIDLSYIRNITVKDADYFIDRRPLIFPSAGDEAFNEMLNAVNGEQWKALRSLVTPTFTSGKIKAMFPFIASKGNDLVLGCDKIMINKGFVEFKSILSLYTMDVIATCAFGFDAHCIRDGNDTQFMKSAKYISQFDTLRVIKLTCLLIAPKFFSLFGMQFSGGHLPFFENVLHETIAKRKEMGIKRGDFLDIMLESLEKHENNDKKINYPFTMKTIIAESILFLLVGFDTTANTLSFVVYLLAKNKDCQKRLREELVKIVETDGEFNYTNIMEAPYLDACLAETLRLYAPAHVIERNCTKPYRFPGTDLDLPLNTLVSIPVWSLHHDPKYWNDPYAFDPERFSPENKQNIVPYSYLPFGSGPRNCVGMRFAQLQAKLAIAKLIMNFEVDLRPGFKEIELEKTQNTLRADKNGVQLVLKKTAFYKI